MRFNIPNHHQLRAHGKVSKNTQTNYIFYQGNLHRSDGCSDGYVWSGRLVLNGTIWLKFVKSTRTGHKNGFSIGSGVTTFRGDPPE